MAESVLTKPPVDRATRDLKVPPHSVEAEQAVLGGLLLDNDAWERIADLLIEQDFYRRDHRALFAAIRSLADSGRPFDTVTTADWLEQHGVLESAGGLAYLGELARDTPSSANIKAYAEILRERAIRRGLARVGTDIVESAFDSDGQSASTLLDLAERKVFELAERGTGPAPSSLPSGRSSSRSWSASTSSIVATIRSPAWRRASTISTRGPRGCSPPI